MPIRLGYGTTVARGRGVWEFALEACLLFETALRECERRNLQVLLVLAPNDAGIPDPAYEGLADRLRALTLQYVPVASFVEPKDLAGRSGPAAGAVIAQYLANPRKGVMVSSVRAPR